MADEAALRRLWRRWTAATIVVALVAVAGLVPIAARGDTQTRAAPFRLEVPDVAPGSRLTVVAGVDHDPQVAANGQDVRVPIEPNATTLVSVRDGGATVALGTAVSAPGVEFPRVDLDDRSSAVAMLFLRPGMLGFDPILDALVYDAALAASGLDRAAAAIAADRDGGGDPFVDPSPELVREVEALGVEVNQILEERTRDLRAAVEEGAADGQAAVSFVGRQRDGRGSLPPACEGDERHPSCGDPNDPEDICRNRNPELVTDFDGFEGDNVCLVVRGREDATDTVVVDAVNYTPRWVNLYFPDNHGIIPDATLAPKEWALPSLDAFLADMLEMLVEYGVDLVWSKLGELFGFASTQPRPLAERFNEIVRGYAAPRTTTTELEVGERGTIVSTSAAGIPRLLSLDRLSRERFLAATVQTAVTEALLPMLSFTLGKSKVGTRCVDEEGESAKALTDHLADRGIEAEVEVLMDLNPADVCAAIIELSQVLVPVAFEVLADRQDPGVDDLFEVVNAVVGASYELLQGTFEIEERLAAPDQAAYLDRLLDAGIDVGDLGKLAVDLIETILTAVLDLDPEQLLQDVFQRLLREAAEAAVAAFVPGAGLIKTINRLVDGANVLAPIIEFLVDAYEHDVVDRYRIQPRALRDLPSAPSDEIFSVSDGTPSTTLLVVDASGSMGDSIPGGTVDKQQEAARAGIALLQVIRADASLGGSHSVGLVAFADGVKDQVRPTSDLDVVHRRLEALQSGGGTQIDTALGAAFGYLEHLPGQRSVVLLTDGQIDVGQQERILETFGELARVTGVTVSTVAFAFEGGNEDQFLRTLAQRTGGQFDAPRSGFELQRVFIRSRHTDTGSVIQDVAGSLDADGRTVVVDVPSTAGGASAGELVISVLTSGRPFALEVLDPLGVSIAADQVRIVEGNPTTIAIARPIPGRWQVAITEGRQGEVVLAAADGPVLAAATEAFGGDFSLVASVRGTASLPPARPPAATSVTATMLAIGVWLLLMLAGSLRLRRRASR